MSEVWNWERPGGHWFRSLQVRRGHVLYNTVMGFNEIIFHFFPRTLQTSLPWWLKAFRRNFNLCRSLCQHQHVGTGVSKGAASWSVSLSLTFTDSGIIASVWGKCQKLCHALHLFLLLRYLSSIHVFNYPQPNVSPPCIWEDRCGSQWGFASPAGSSLGVDVTHAFLVDMC